MARIYLDHNAETPLSREARAAMIAYLDRCQGNPSSLHEEGRLAREAVERARREVAELLGARPEDVVFTSGGTEADNLAILGAARAVLDQGRRAHVVTSPLEHPAVREAARALMEGDAFVVTELPVDGEGGIDPEDLRRALRPDTALVSLSAANHEIGRAYPVEEYAAAARAVGALFHCDAVQGAGRVGGLAAADLISVSAHKLYGPSGVGALVGPAVARSLSPILRGGHQERGRRPGTEPSAAIAGFGAACALWRREGSAREERVRRLRDRLESVLLALPGARLFGPRDGAQRVAGTLDVGFAGADGQLVAAGLDLEGIAVSTGSACTSGSIEPSPVLLAMAVPPQVARTAVRFSLGWGTSEEEITRVSEVVPRVVARVRAVG